MFHFSTALQRHQDEIIPQTHLISVLFAADLDFILLITIIGFFFTAFILSWFTRVQMLFVFFFTSLMNGEVPAVWVRVKVS